MFCLLHIRTLTIFNTDVVVVDSFLSEITIKIVTTKYLVMMFDMRKTKRK